LINAIQSHAIPLLNAFRTGIITEGYENTAGVVWCAGEGGGALNGTQLIDCWCAQTLASNTSVISQTTSFKILPEKLDTAVFSHIITA
jgi:hypothetical protein